MWKYPCNEKVFVFYQFKSIKPCFRWNAKIVKDWNLKIRNNHLLKKGGNVKEKNYDEHTNEQFRSKFSVWISLKSASFLNNCMYICTQAVYFAYYCCCFYFYFYFFFFPFFCFLSLNEFYVTRAWKISDTCISNIWANI